jgi:orotate phosphoribosyltransferase
LLTHDAELKEVLCVIERDPAGRANLEEAEFVVHSLFKMEELFESEEISQ